MSLISRQITLVLTICILLCACSGSGSGAPAHRFRTYSEGGITIAENDGGPKYPGEIFRYEKVLELRADPAVEGSLLFQPWEISRDRDGNIYVEDEGDMSIVMFDAEGKFQRRFGREGHGPGEFRRMDLPRIAGDLLYVFDSRQNRITRFRRSGELVDVLPVPASLSPGLVFYNVLAVILARDERRIIIRQLMGRGGTEGTMGKETIVLSAANDTLWSVATPMVTSSFVTRYENSMGISLIPYGVIPSIACHPEFGIFVSDGEQPVVQRYTIDGERDLEVSFLLEREAVTATEKAAVQRTYTDAIEDARDRSRGFAEAQREALIIADRKPLWTDVVVDDAGYLWLLQSESFNEIKAAGGSLFRVVSPEGEYLGDSRGPNAVSNASISQGCICFLVEEESGEMIPVLYRIRSNVEGLVYP